MTLLRLAAVAVCSLVVPVFVSSGPVVASLPFKAPDNLVKVSASKDAIKVTWHPDGTPPRFEVQYARKSDFKVRANRFTRTPSIVLSKLARRTSYYVRVRASSDKNTALSPWSAVKKYRTGPMPLRIATFNIKDPDTDGGSCGPWEGRKAGVVRDILSSNADVVGIQEAYQPRNRTSLMDAIDAAAGVGTYEMTLPEADTNGWDNRLVYNTKRVELASSGTVQYAHQDPDPDKRKKGRHYVWGIFTLKANGHKFMVFSTHIQPSGSTSLKKAQWEELRKAARANSVVNGKQLPVFIMGDFNSSKWRTEAGVMLPRMKASGFGDPLGQVYRSYVVRGQRAKVTKDAWINSYNDCKRHYSHVRKTAIGNNIDWIFASNNLPIVYWRTITHHKGDLLNTPIPSDHFLMYLVTLLP